MCGLTKRPRSKCRYREFTCNFCQRTGHLENARRQKRNKKNPTKHIKTIYKLDCSHQTKQFNKSSSAIQLQINGHNSAFELDSRMFNVIISMED